MKKLWVLLCCVVLAAALCGGGEKTMRSEEELLERARKELPLANADTTELRYAGCTEKEGSILFWFISGSEYQAHTYLPMECTVTQDGGYRFERCYDALMRVRDVAVLPWWQRGFAFLVNNESCVAIRIEPLGGEGFTVPADTLPFLYYYDGSMDFSYFFLDEAGNALPEN